MTRPSVGIVGSKHAANRPFDQADHRTGCSSEISTSLHSSLYLLPISDPTGVMWTIGLTGKFHFSDEVALLFDPQVGVMLSHRDLYKEQLFIPLELQLQMTADVSFKVVSGVSGQLSQLGDTYQIPLGLGVVGNVPVTFAPPSNVLPFSGDGERDDCTRRPGAKRRSTRGPCPLSAVASPAARSWRCPGSQRTTVYTVRFWSTSQGTPLGPTATRTRTPPEANFRPPTPLWHWPRRRERWSAQVST